MSAVEYALRAAVIEEWRAAAVMAAWRSAGHASSGKVTLSIPAAVVDSVRPAVQLRLYPPVFLYRTRPHVLI